MSKVTRFHVFSQATYTILKKQTSRCIGIIPVWLPNLLSPGTPTLGSWMKLWPERVFGGNEPAHAILKHSIIVCNKSTPQEIDYMSAPKACVDCRWGTEHLNELTPKIDHFLTAESIQLSLWKHNWHNYIFCKGYKKQMQWSRNGVLTVFPAPFCPTIRVKGL